MNFRTLIAIAAFIFAVTGFPVLAQTPSSGPVQIPASSALPAPSPATIYPAPASVPASQSTVAGDIHDIRGPIAIPYEWLWAAYIVGALVIAAVLYAAWRFFRKHTVAKAKLPFEIALEKLEAARALMTTDSVREYAFAVSEIIRVYIEQRFGEKAARRTTEEFLSDLLQQTGTPLAEHRRRLEDFLNHCDLIKFARWGASTGDMESMHESARVFIIDTKPQPEAAKPAKVTTLAQPELAQAK
jgi:hypothetical protein